MYLRPLHCCLSHCQAVVARVETPEPDTALPRAYCAKCINDMKLLVDQLGMGSAIRPDWYWETGGWKWRREDRMYGSPVPMPLPASGFGSISAMFENYMQSVKFL